MTRNLHSAARSAACLLLVCAGALLGLQSVPARAGALDQPRENRQEPRTGSIIAELDPAAAEVVGGAALAILVRPLAEPAIGPRPPGGVAVEGPASPIVWAARHSGSWSLSDSRGRPRRLDDATAAEVERLIGQVGPTTGERLDGPRCAELTVRRAGKEQTFLVSCRHEGDIGRLAQIVLAGRVADWSLIPADLRSGSLPIRRFIANTSTSAARDEDLELFTVIHDEAGWRDFWRDLNRGQRRPPPAPLIDFEQETLLVARMATQRTGGYAATIVDVIEGRSEIVARVRFQTPGPTCGTTAALTTPMDIVGVPATDKPVRWTVERMASDCG